MNSQADRKGKSRKTKQSCCSEITVEVNHPPLEIDYMPWIVSDIKCVFLFKGRKGDEHMTVSDSL